MRPDPSVLPPEIAIIADPVSRRLERFLDDQVEEWTLVAPDIEAVLTAIHRLVFAGGKRLRPAFCYWAFVGSGGEPDDPFIVDAGAAYELLHAFALIHDDVMDGSSTRRGHPAVHIEFADRHRRSGWQGEDRRLGEGVAILAGDLAAVFADQLMSDAPREARTLWHLLKVEVNVGQYLDVVGTARGNVGLESARRISQLKSGRYTVERPLQLGASLAGALDRAGPGLVAYGEPLGVAFQMRDDLLGVFGDPAQTGKPVADDLREGKPTPLLAIARARAEGSDAALLDRSGAPDLEVDELISMRDVLERTGARAEVERTIDHLREQAVARLDDVDLTPRARRALATLADYVARRDR